MIEALLGMKVDIEMLKTAFGNALKVGPIEVVDSQKGYRLKLGEGPDGKPQLVADQTFVTTGPTRGDQIAVLKGLTPGQVVVTSGQLKLSNGTPLVVNNAVQPSDNPNAAPPNPN